MFKLYHTRTTVGIHTSIVYAIHAHGIKTENQFECYHSNFDFVSFFFPPSYFPIGIHILHANIRNERFHFGRQKAADAATLTH